jgi:hypothetical protein
MLRSLLRFTGALALAALVVSPAVPNAAPAPGVAYDEIVRVLVGATPPPPGNFQTDLAALDSASLATPTPAPKKRGLNFGNLAGIALGGGGAGDLAGAAAGDVADNAIENSLERSLGAQFAAIGSALRGFLSPHLMRYAYYNGWERVEDVTAQTATIRKCDIGQIVQLDLAKRTYSIYDPANEPPPSAPAAAPARRGPPPTAPPPQPPGTAVADFSTTTRALGPARIENLPTSGYASTASFALTQATGSCRNGGASIQTTEYLSALNQPAVNSCPLKRPPPIPESASDVAAPPPAAGGCRPTFTYHNSGPPVPPGKLSMYTLVSMNGAGGPTPAPAASGAGGIGFLTERGNVRALGAANASLFDIPAGFTKTP